MNEFNEIPGANEANIPSQNIDRQIDEREREGGREGGQGRGREEEEGRQRSVFKHMYVSGHRIRPGIRKQDAMAGVQGVGAEGEAGDQTGEGDFRGRSDKIKNTEKSKFWYLG